MKALKLFFGLILIGTFTSSCYTEVVIEDEFIDEPTFSLGEMLSSYDLWYINIHETEGNGEVPFLQKAFTVSFNQGVFNANNNLTGFGSTGNGLGIDVGYYNTSGVTLEVDHDLDGVWAMEVIQLDDGEIELYHRSSRTSYFLTGYQKNNFDYDYVFYDNIHYFLKEYNVWEKTYVSEEGALNDFDEENFLRFLNTSNSTFFSSIDDVSTPINNINWDYIGVYEVFDVEGDDYIKTLTFDYDGLGNDYFEILVLDGNTIELFHPDSGTIYEFTGRGYIEYLKNSDKKQNIDSSRKRKKIINKKMDVKRKSERRKIKIS